MTSLSPQQVLFVHARLIAETGGSPGIRDLALLQVAVTAPGGPLGDQDSFQDLFSTAAGLMARLAGNRPFVDGNEGVALTSAGLLLRLNGHLLTASHEEAASFTLLAAGGEVTTSDIAAWLRTNSRPHGS